MNKSDGRIPSLRVQKVSYVLVCCFAPSANFSVPQASQLLHFALPTILAEENFNSRKKETFGAGFQQILVFGRGIIKYMPARGSFILLKLGDDSTSGVNIFSSLLIIVLWMCPFTIKSKGRPEISSIVRSSSPQAKNPL